MIGQFPIIGFILFVLNLVIPRLTVLPIAIMPNVLFLIPDIIVQVQQALTLLLKIGLILSVGLCLHCILLFKQLSIYNFIMLVQF